MKTLKKDEHYRCNGCGYELPHLRSCRFCVHYKSPNHLESCPLVFRLKERGFSYGEKSTALYHALMILNDIGCAECLTSHEE